MIKEWQKLALIIIVFLAAYYIPFSEPKVQEAIDVKIRICSESEFFSKARFLQNL